MRDKSDNLSFEILNDVTSLDFLEDLYVEGFRDYFMRISGEKATIADPHNDYIGIPDGKNYDDKRYCVSYLEREGKKIPVGIADLVIDYPSEGMATLGLLLVDMRWRRRGVGRFMLNKIHEILDAHGQIELITYLISGDIESIGFFEKRGFNRYDRRTTRVINSMKSEFSEYRLILPRITPSSRQSA